MIIDPTFCGSRFFTGRLLAIEDFKLIFSAKKTDYTSSSHLIIHTVKRISSIVKSKQSERNIYLCIICIAVDTRVLLNS